MVAAPGRTTVAVDGVAVLGTANMYANRAGPGAHVASASFMVASTAQGRGVGRALVEDALTWARAAGFRAMQFNAVAETNAAAVGLYHSVGFSIAGTVPEAFDHPEHGSRRAAHHVPEASMRRLLLGSEPCHRRPVGLCCTSRRLGRSGAARTSKIPASGRVRLSVP